jgi:hypothetical protein
MSSPSSRPRRLSASSPRRPTGACATTPDARQLGLEPTPALYVERMVDIFRGVRRVLREDGTVWVNVGDTYVGKELSGIPWRLALALKDDGWRLRCEIVWSKPNVMPESATDRRRARTRRSSCSRVAGATTTTPTRSGKPTKPAAATADARPRSNRSGRRAPPQACRTGRRAASTAPASRCRTPRLASGPTAAVRPP